MSGAVLENYFRRRPNKQDLPTPKQRKSLSDIVEETLSEAKDGIGFWLIPSGRDEFAKAKILPSYKIGASRLSIKKQEVDTLSGRQLFTDRPDRHRRSGPNDSTFLPIWSVMAQQKTLRKYFPWLEDMIQGNKEVLFDPKHPENIDTALFVQSSIMSKGWSYYVVEGDTGYFGTYFNNLPKYWDAFTAELFGEHLFAPESIQAPPVDHLAFVDPRGGVIGKINLNRVKSYDLGDARTISDAISIAKRKGASEFDQPEGDDSASSRSSGSGGYGSAIPVDASREINSPYDSLDFSRPDFDSLRFENFASYPIISTYISKNGYKESDVTNVIDFLRRYKDWLAGDSANHEKVSKLAEIIEHLPELVELHATDAGVPFDASDYEREHDPDEGSEPDDVPHDTDDTWGDAADSTEHQELSAFPVDSVAIYTYPSGTEVPVTIDGPVDNSPLLDVTFPNNQHGRVDPSDLKKPTKQNSQKLRYYRAPLELPSGSKEEPPQHPALPDKAAERRKNASRIIDLDPKDVEILTDDDDEPITESAQSLLMEVTFRRLIALTAQNGGYKYGGMVKVNGKWIYDPDIPGRIENSSFIVKRPPRPKTDDDGFVRIDYNFKARPDRSTTGMRQHGYVKFIPPGFIRKMLRKIGIGRPKSQWDMDVHVFCTCPDFKYRWHVALADQKAAARPDPSAGQALDQPPKITNPSKKLSLCKHLVAMGSYLQKTKKDYDKDLEQWKKDREERQRDEEDAIEKNTKPTGPEQAPEVLPGADVTDAEEGDQ